ncbi:SH3 domain-containing protein [Streptomyces sp. NPDC004647]|uniref:SH3 domain-containing protein n=1 Tax=Streptomyces sp. NPDC004647 TaxID=3154671 RepID=UPI0033A766D1
MSRNSKARGRQLAMGTCALAAAATLGGSLLGVAPAQAAATKAVPALPYGTVVPPDGVNERQYPSTDSSVVGFLRYRTQVGLKCKVRAQNIDGNTVWYLLRDRPAWVSARYVDNTGVVKYCKDVQRSPLNNSQQAQTARG